MSVSIIVAMARHDVIGRAGTLPWHLPDDLRRFKQITLGHAIVMGRKTYESIGRPLPGRRNIVVTATPSYQAPGCLCVSSLPAAIMAAGNDPEIMVIGGHALYDAALPIATRLYMTEIDAEIQGDVYFPPFERAEWCETAREFHPRDTTHAYAFSFVVLERVAAST
jgi:dihydrofolate reductase